MKKVYKISLTFIILLSLSTPLRINAEDGQIKLTQPATLPIEINEPGSYILTSNINGGTYTGNIAIHIKSHDVFLDLNGHTIIGPGKAGIQIYGIYAYEKSNITIKNGTVQEFAGNGITIIHGTNHQVMDLNVHDNGINGISISTSSSVIISNCNSSYNGSLGIIASNASMQNAVANHNGNVGISASDSTIIKCTSNSNGDTGIHSERSTVADCSANANGGAGFALSQSLINNSAAVGNSGPGISAWNSKVIHCIARTNQGAGITAHRSTVFNTSAYANYSNGIEVTEHSRIDGCHVFENGYHSNPEGTGIHLTGSNNCVIRNSASGNKGGSFSSAVTGNYMPTSTTAADAANANIGF